MRSLQVSRGTGTPSRRPGAKPSVGGGSELAGPDFSRVSVSRPSLSPEATATLEGARREPGVGATGLPVLRQVEAATGRSLADVRLHQGAAADRAATALGARAITLGRDIYLGRDSYRPGVPEGDRVLAHELVHALQGGLRPDETPTSELRISGSDQASERRADAFSRALVRGRTPAGRSLDVGTAPQGQIQRDDVTSQRITETNRSGNTYSQNLSVNRTTRVATISLGVNWVREGTWGAMPDRAEEVYQAFISWIRSTVGSYLNGHFKVVCSPRQSDAGATRPLEVLLAFRLDDDPSGYRIRLIGGQHGTSSMGTGGGQVYQLGLPNESTQQPQTVAHELGHALLGANDEYASASDPQRPVYTDDSIMGNYYNAPTRAEFKVRHLQHLLAPIAALYPDHTCTLVRY